MCIFSRRILFILFSYFCEKLVFLAVHIPGLLQTLNMAGKGILVLWLSVHMLQMPGVNGFIPLNASSAWGNTSAFDLPTFRIVSRGFSRSLSVERRASSLSPCVVACICVERRALPLACVARHALPRALMEPSFQGSRIEHKLLNELGLEKIYRGIRTVFLHIISVMF